MLSDQQIVSLVNKGKVDMYSELVVRYQQPVYRLACNLLANRTDAEDASQEVFLRAYKSLSTYSDQGRFWGWLRRITINICLRQASHIQTTAIDDLEDIIDSESSEICESMIHLEEMEELRKMINQLPLSYRSVIVLKYLEDMSYVEIAEILDDSISNIQVRIHRAKKMLRERVKVCII